MSCLINADNGVTSGITGIRTTADNTGNLALQSNGVTLLTATTANTLSVSNVATLSISGATSGAVALAVPAVAGTNTLTLPAVTGNILTDKTVGVVLQVVQITNSTGFTANSATFVDTGIAASITPKFSTSKILVSASVPIIGQAAAGTTASFAISLYRGTTSIFQQTPSYGYLAVSTQLDVIAQLQYLDSPATTSSVTYKIYAANGGTNMLINYLGINTSVITLMEIAA